jgi:hypothetical protein
VLQAANIRNTVYAQQVCSLSEHSTVHPKQTTTAIQDFNKIVDSTCEQLIGMKAVNNTGVQVHTSGQEWVVRLVTAHD